MRLWSVHPTYLDAKGLVALWRETLLAQKVLLGETKGYRNHPQLIRFREQENPMGAIGHYLSGVHEEATLRGYRFDRTKIVAPEKVSEIPVTTGQIGYEWEHLLRKLETRDPNRFDQIKKNNTNDVKPHPMFNIIEGSIEHWERFTK
ncbi:pyrimidine dimer DNA glycosylase/endonuclease V [Alkalibacillus haloalkaliphilus]|uniref:pyrimidine dimer DNA glycosylase/endonuclease V n=1 Tax=Alkalibacillus haloalkaliphilus TaxID=94136 RepID=UPI0029361B15|nr:pyrimidine dimer DNA glycosylase/endonuclease V [Alkalibacillus haloalkaliphilus]MDV2583069.1 pyrimidine dimer DNA glycosylase/endonuclease V [Alkalibacillus haloalkaliphilus]